VSSTSTSTTAAAGSDLSSVVDAWEQSIRAIAEVVSPLPEGRWNRRTDCPGWSVRDIVSHVIGMESELLGDPRPIHNLPSDLSHASTDASRYTEVQVDIRRCHTGPEMTAELAQVTERRLRALRNSTAAPEDPARGFMGIPMTYELALRMRVFDIWVHEQDLRRAVGTPGGLDTAAAQVTRDWLFLGLPKVVAKQAALPPGSTVVFDVHGPLEFMRTVTVDDQGRGHVSGRVALGPLVTVSTDWETFTLLMCGRIRPRDAALTVEGDQDAATRVLRNIAVTP
jgi:uncharacterized protein (TIGR03083 family)